MIASQAKRNSSDSVLAGEYDPHQNHNAHRQPSANSGERVSLADLASAIQDIQPSADPAAVFERVAQVCVRQLAPACIVWLAEKDSEPCRISAGDRRLVTRVASGFDFGDVLSSRHEVTRNGIAIPILPPPTEGLREYRGRFELRWCASHTPGNVDLAVAQMVVDHAEIKVQSALMTARVEAERALVANLEIALESNRTIGIAVGILMAQHRMTADSALHLLRRASQTSHRKMRDISDEVAFTGGLPGRQVRRPA